MRVLSSRTLRNPTATPCQAHHTTKKKRLLDENAVWCSKIFQGRAEDVYDRPAAEKRTTVAKGGDLAYVAGTRPRAAVVHEKVTFTHFEEHL